MEIAIRDYFREMSGSQAMLDLVSYDKEHDFYYMVESGWKVFHGRLMEQDLYIFWKLTLAAL